MPTFEVVSEWFWIVIFARVHTALASNKSHFKAVWRQEEELLKPLNKTAWLVYSSIDYKLREEPNKTGK